MNENMMTPLEHLAALYNQTGWDETANLDLLSRFIQDRNLSAAFRNFIEEVYQMEIEESEE